MPPFTISAILLPTFGLTLLLGTGCKDDKPSVSNTGAGEKSSEDGKAPSAATVKTPIPPGKGVIKGKIAYGGTEPVAKILKEIEDHKTEGGQQVCLAPGGASEFENRDQTLKIDHDMGIANVVIFLKAPQGKYFEVREADKNRSDLVEIDQPHCAFVPHVVALFPEYWDGEAKKMQTTGQKFKIKNSAPFLHNVNVSWGGTTFNQNISSKDSFVFPKPFPPSARPYTLSCSMHNFMRAKVWSFDHPYFDVTKDDGSFEIRNVPTAEALNILAWHERASTAPEPFYTASITLKEGEPKDPAIPAMK